MSEDRIRAYDDMQLILDSHKGKMSPGVYTASISVLNFLRDHVDDEITLSDLLHDSRACVEDFAEVILIFNCIGFKLNIRHYSKEIDKNIMEK